MGAARGNVVQRHPARPLAKLHLYCGPAAGKHRRALFDRGRSMPRSSPPISNRCSVRLRAGDTLILDNLSTHKIQSVGALLGPGVELRYLPPYSPISIPLNRRSPNSKPTCAKRRPAPWKISWPWPTPSIPSRPNTAGLLSSCPICVYLNRKCSRTAARSKTGDASPI